MSSSPVLLRFAAPVTPTPGPVPLRFGAAELAAGEAVTGTLLAADALKTRCRSCGAPATAGERCGDCGREVPFPDA